MKTLRISASMIFIVLLISVSVFAQDETFTSPDVDYTFKLPDSKWKMTVKPSPTIANVEYVFTDRNDGHLEVRKLASPTDPDLAIVMRGEEQKLQFLPGYVTGKQEPFAGQLKGNVFNFEFVRNGRPMSGRFYFLRSGVDVYVLRFTGFRDSLRGLRAQTDSIARTFGKVK